MKTEPTCFHCGDICTSQTAIAFEKTFCCNGCKMVYQLLHENALDNYYQLEKTPGLKTQEQQQSQHQYLDEPSFQNELLLFKDDHISKISLYLPQIHCSSCIWLLENLSKLNKNVLQSEVNFVARKATITFKHLEFKLSELAILLHRIGYPPNFKNTDKKTNKDKSALLKLGVAGFCFGNIMLLSFAEYLGMDATFSTFQTFFSWISLLLSLPIVLYAGSDYLKSAYQGLIQRSINMDIPIALGILVLFFRSAYEIISQTGSGYLDSLAGLLFFLLIGKWFQKKSYDALSFERDYKSYFPMGVQKLENNTSSIVKIEALKKGDIIAIHNEELIPADSILQSPQAEINYSFVTGESKLVEKQKGDIIYAGGKHLGSKITLKVEKPVNNSYLTQLWNQDAFTKTCNHSIDNTNKKISQYFTLAILAITSITAIYWSQEDPSKLWNTITAVLIVACPCALALCVPFTLGNAVRLLGKVGLYVKNSNVIEQLARINKLAFDKTGTLTESGKYTVLYEGQPLNEVISQAIHSLASQSIHPLSKSIAAFLPNTSPLPIFNFQEISGKGLAGIVNGKNLKVGSAQFLGISNSSSTETRVYVEENGEKIGCFILEQPYRDHIKTTLRQLADNYDMHLLSGDSNEQEKTLREWGFQHTSFKQTPIQKLNYIKGLQIQQNKVLMLGDGLNDAGALKQSDVGISITDDVHQFTPACDAIFESTYFNKLPQILKFSKRCLHIIYTVMGISFLYNTVGLYFAVTGQLTPIIAAILMPLSSITVVVIATLATRASRINKMG